MARSLFLWEGVTTYLHAEAVDATLTWVRTYAAPGSVILFDYQCSGPQTGTRHSCAHLVLSHFSGERRDFRIVHSQIEDFLTRRGFTHVVDVDAEQIQRHYCAGPNQGRTVAANYAIVYAEVGKSLEGVKSAYGQSTCKKQSV